MAINQLTLLKQRKFLPLFLTQFLGAFNDNIYKTALVILITYDMIGIQLTLDPAIVITIAAGIFILPFFLFSASAGQLSDKFEKTLVIRCTKMIEIILGIFAYLGLYLQNLNLLMTVLFLLGTQAAFFGPVKYSILPNLLKTEELIAGNALIEAGTYLAILTGTIAGGILAILPGGKHWVAITVIITALIGFLICLWIPKTSVAEPKLHFKYNLFAESWKIINDAFKVRALRLAILGISWFWLIGATYLSQLPTFTKQILTADSSVVTLFLVLFSVGIGIGALLCNSLLKGEINAKYVPLAAIGMTIFGIDLVFASQQGIKPIVGLSTLSQFLNYLSDWRIIMDFLLISIAGGIYTVPLYAILQESSDIKSRSRVVAANNILNAFFMVIASVITSMMLYLGYSVTDVFLYVAIANLVVAVYIYRLK